MSSTEDEYIAEYDPAWVGEARVEALKDEFEKKDDPLSDNSDKIKDALAALLTLGAVVAYCSGPAGAGVGAAMSTGVGIVTALKEPPKSDSDVTKIVRSIEAMQRNEKVNKQLAAIKAYWSWLKINKDTIETTDSNQKGALKSILNTLENNHTDPSHELFLSTMPHHTEVLWEKAASRLAAAACVSCLMSAHSIRCRIYAWLALDSKAHGKLNAYKEYRASFTSACSVMQKTANEKRKEINNMIKTAAEQRANMIRGPDFDFKNQKWPEGYEWPDHTPSQTTESKATPCWFVEDTHTGKYGTWRQQGFWPTAFMNNWIFNKETTPPKDAETAAFSARSRARQYAWLSAHPTRVVMDSWNSACTGVKLDIYPQMKSGHKPEKIREETVESPHPWICDAKTVQWAYKLRTEDGTSGLSDRSDRFTLPADLSPDKPARLPVFKLEDFGFPTSTQRVVFHRKITKSGGQEAYGPEPVQARVIEGAAFADVMPDF